MKLIKKYKKIIMLGSIVCTVFLLMIAAAVLIYQELPEYGTLKENRSEEQFIHDMWSGITVEQEFVCTSDCEFISLEFSDHDGSISGKTHFLIARKNDGQIVTNVEIENGDIHYAEPVRLYLDGGGKAGQSYVLTISAIDASEDAALGLYGYVPGEGDEGEPVCLINGVKSEYAVGIGEHTDTVSYKVHFFLVFGMLAFMLLLCTFFTEYKQAKPETLFLCIAVPIGIIFISFLNVNTVHDGSTHLTNVYKYSNIILGKADRDSQEYVYLSPDETELRKETDNFYVLLERINHKAGEGTDWQPYYEERPTNNESILEYFPGAFGMTLGRMLQLSAMSALLVAKLFCLAFYIAICYLAIRTTPFLKGGFATAAFLPMNLYQAAGITYDAVTTPAAYLVFALILKGRQEKLSKREWYTLFLFSMILGSCKGGTYIPILLLMIFIQSEFNGGIKNKIKACLVSWILAGGTLIYTYRSEFKNFFFQYEPDEIEQLTQAAEAAGEISWAVKDQVLIPKLSLGYLFTNPFDFVKMFIRTIFEKADYYLGSMVGNRMAWTDAEIGWAVISVFLILLAFSIVWKEAEQVKDISVKERLTAGLLLLCEVVGFHAIMLVETRIGQITIFGVQGRYFLPLIPIGLFLLFSKSRKKTTEAANREMLVMCLAQIIYMFDFMKVIYRIA